MSRPVTRTVTSEQLQDIAAKHERAITFTASTGWLVLDGVKYVAEIPEVEW